MGTECEENAKKEPTRKDFEVWELLKQGRANMGDLVKRSIPF